MLATLPCAVETLCSPFPQLVKITNPSLKCFWQLFFSQHANLACISYIRKNLIVRPFTFDALQKNTLHIALVGNPNSGKSSLFNALTGLKQQVGNFPGVTVDKKTGECDLGNGQKASIIDLPGTYSIYPRRADEMVAYKVLMGADAEIKPDMVILAADASNIKRNLLFVSQMIDLKVPMVVALSMIDLASKKGITIDVQELERELGVPVIVVNPRKSRGIGQLKKAVLNVLQTNFVPSNDFINIRQLAPDALAQIGGGNNNQYRNLHWLMHASDLLPAGAEQDRLQQIVQQTNFSKNKVQAEEVMQRYQQIRSIMQNTVVEEGPLQKHLFTEKLDRILLHRVWGYIILIAVLFILFQSIFSLAALPMDGIEWSFTKLSGWLSQVLPSGWWSDLLINGVVAGLSGIAVFVPQIMILFGLITLLEDTGYMARISFLTDRMMRRSGLNGKSVMPMISGFACAVPAIMSTRNIENRKERLLTILITPLMSCSARLPVYTILIGLVVPDKKVLGIFGWQGLVMFGLYLLGVALALLIAWIFKLLIRIQEKSYFILELPTYRGPRWGNIGSTMLEKAKIFIYDAGKVILIISLILWALSNFGPGNTIPQLKAQMEAELQLHPENEATITRNFANAKLENSYAGNLGKFIEPAIRPLGFDWKIGIALITSFAAREVFVGTMATLYSVGEEEDTRLRAKLEAATFKDGSKVYSLATGLSLMVFYLLAMQCMSTLAVVKRETKTWKWPLVQLAYMTVLAYSMSWLVYTLAK
jgi:ferrous iron transport protein B